MNARSNLRQFYLAALLLALCWSGLLCAQAPAKPAKSAACAQDCKSPKLKPLACSPLLRFQVFNPSGGNTGVHLKNPLSDSTDVLYVVVMGDSVVWGNGLFNPDTFMYKFGQNVADETGRNVQVVYYAHSGARFYRIDDYTSTLYFDAQGNYIGDISSERPTTEEQAACAAQQFPQAEILVMDGCINEVGATEIALPFPLNFTNPNEIVQGASDCGSHWSDFLQNGVLNNFQKATAIVLNYYQVVSDLSKPLVVPAKAPGAAAGPDPDEVAHGQAVEDLEERRLSLMKKSGMSTTQAKTRIARGSGPNTVGARAVTSNQKIVDWSTNSQAFLVTSQNCAIAAVNVANGIENATPCPKIATYDPTIRPNPPPPLIQATQSSRAYLAAPAPYPWPPTYSYGAPEHHIWYLPIPEDREYEDYSEQEKRCKAEFNLISLTDYYGCIWDPMAHPNVLGAESYRQGLLNVLTSAWKVD
jgi:hypothetical protein